jgi:hypothetical protein
VHAKSPALLVDSVFVGYEMHKLLGTADSSWANLGSFWKVGRSRSAFLWGNEVVFSTVASYGVMFDLNMRARYNQLFDVCDAPALNYYPILADYTVPAATAPIGDQSRISGLYPSQDIYIIGAS